MPQGLNARQTLTLLLGNVRAWEHLARTSKNPYVLEIIFRDKIYSNPQPSLMQAMAQNPHLRPELVVKLLECNLKTDCRAELGFLLKKTFIPIRLLRAYFNQLTRRYHKASALDKYYICQMIASLLLHPQCPRYIKRASRVNFSKNYTVLKSLIKISDDPRFLKKCLANCSSPSLFKSFIYNSLTTQSQLDYALEMYDATSDLGLLRRLIRHPNLSEAKRVLYHRLIRNFRI